MRVRVTVRDTHQFKDRIRIGLAHYVFIALILLLVVGFGSD